RFNAGLEVRGTENVGRPRSPSRRSFLDVFDALVLVEVLGVFELILIGWRRHVFILRFADLVVDVRGIRVAVIWHVASSRKRSGTGAARGVPEPGGSEQPA